MPSSIASPRLLIARKPLAVSRRLGRLILALLSIGLPASAAQLHATPATFDKVLLAAKAGDTVLLESGAYPSITLKGGTLTHPLTIASARPKDPAVISDLTIVGGQGLVFRNIEFVVSGPKAAAVHAMKSSSLTFDHVFVHGSLDDDASNDGVGLAFHNTSDLTITNSDFTQLRQAIADGGEMMTVNGQRQMGTPDRAVIQGNRIHGIMKSGMVFAAVSDVTISGNTITDIRVVPPEHPDAIQFFTTNTTQPAHDITITNNLIDRGPGAAAQGVFLRDQVGTVHYQHVVIAHNLIVGTGFGGIAVDGATALEISNNELISFPGSNNNTWIIVQRSDQVTATNNRAQSITFEKIPSLTESGNRLTKPVNDQGAAALAAWGASHPVDPASRPGIVGDARN